MCEIKYSLLFALCLFSLSPEIRAQDACVQKSPCKCEFPNGTGIDLTPTATSTFFEANVNEQKPDNSQMKLNKYFFHPCMDTLLNNVPAPCDKPLGLCRHTSTLTLNASLSAYQLSQEYDDMGYNTKVVIDPYVRNITFLNGPSKTEVLLICADTDSVLHVQSTLEPNEIELSFYSRYACLKQIEEVGRSFGSTLLIIFFSFVIFYLVLGILTKKFLMGATGVEVIPNLSFWTDLPNLVRDGWAFTINGFRLPTRGPGPVTSPDPNSYDSI